MPASGRLGVARDRGDGGAIASRRLAKVAATAANFAGSARTAGKAPRSAWRMAGAVSEGATSPRNNRKGTE